VSTAVAFATLDRQVRAALRTLHNYLWMGEKADVKKLREDFTAIGARWEAFLGKKSGVAKNVAARAVKLSRETEQGGALYGFVSNFWYLTAATVHLRGKKYATAAAACCEAVDGPMIGLASGFDHHDWVDEKDAGRITYEEYAHRIADLLDGKGVKNVARFKRLATVVAELKDDVAVNNVPDQALAVKAAIHTAALFLALYPEVLEDLGWETTVPPAEHARLARFVASRA